MELLPGIATTPAAWWFVPCSGLTGSAGVAGTSMAGISVGSVACRYLTGRGARG